MLYHVHALGGKSRHRTDPSLMSAAAAAQAQPPWSATTPLGHRTATRHAHALVALRPGLCG